LLKIICKYKTKKKLIDTTENFSGLGPLQTIQKCLKKSHNQNWLGVGRLNKYRGLLPLKLCSKLAVRQLRIRTYGCDDCGSL